MILKDRFITQSAPDIRHKLQKRAYGPNQSLDTLLQLAQMVYYGREYEEKKERQERQRNTLVMVVRTILKQPEKNAQRDPGEKGWACYVAPSSMSGLQRTTLEERLPSEARFSRQSGLKVLSIVISIPYLIVLLPESPMSCSNI